MWNRWIRWTQQAAPILLDGLEKLEYRGCDSAGLAVRDGDKLADVVKSIGRLKNLSEKVDGGKAMPGMRGITSSQAFREYLKKLPGLM